jgi:hypothetical protein
MPAGACIATTSGSVTRSSKIELLHRFLPWNVQSPPRGPCPQGGAHRSPVKTPEPYAGPVADRRLSTENANVDQAALALATVAAAVTLASTPGPYGWASTAVGVTLLFLVLAYHHPRAVSRQGRLSGPGRDAAYGAVVGLLSAMAISWLWSATVANAPRQCQDLAKALAETKDLLRHAALERAHDECLGSAVAPWFGWSWLVLAVLAGLLHAHMRRRPEDRHPAPHPRDDRTSQGIA